MDYACRRKGFENGVEAATRPSITSSLMSNTLTLGRALSSSPDRCGQILADASQGSNVGMSCVFGYSPAGLGW